MSQIQSAYVNALLADASYVKEIKIGALFPTDFKDRLTETQTTYLAENFTVLTSIETPNTMDLVLGTP